MKNKLFFIILIIPLYCMAQEQLSIDWDESLTEANKNSNPTFVSYPLSVKDQIPAMKCTDDETWRFSVSATQKVKFADGNLQYQASTKTWRFAENQWDLVGDDRIGTVYNDGIKSNNNNVSAYYNGWIDLFGWATSGYNNMYPYMTLYNPTKYGPNGTTILSQYDWGYYNFYPWRTLTYTEWQYLLSGRSNASNLFCNATVHNVQGLILFPDNWINSSGLSLIFGAANFNANIILDADWIILESDGAVFLPAAGNRYTTVGDGYGIENILQRGYYWSFSYQNTQRAWAFTFADNSTQVLYFYRSQGCSVRLVRNL